MFARVTQIEIDTMRMGVDEALERYQLDVMPRLRSQPGYRGVYVLTTPEGKALLMSLWDAADDARTDIDTGFYGETLGEFVTLFRAPPGRERYEVRLAEQPDGTQLV